MPIKCELYLYRTVVLLALVAMGTVLPARAQLGLGMVPMRVEIHMTPGQEYSGSLKLSNQSTALTRVRGEVLDFDIDDQTTPQFERDLPQEAPYSCKKWLSLNPMESELPSGGAINARYTLRAPASVAEGSYNCGAGFTTMPAAGDTATGIGMRMAVRIVAAIYVVVGSPPIQGGLKEFKLEALPPAQDATEGGWQAVVVLENRGRVYFRPTGILEVVDDKDNVVEKEDLLLCPSCLNALSGSFSRSSYILNQDATGSGRTSISERAKSNKVPLT